MKASMVTKLEHMLARRQQLEQSIAQGPAQHGQAHYQKMTKELHDLLPVCDTYRTYQSLGSQLDELETMLADDPSLKDMIADEKNDIKVEIQTLESRILTLLLPQDPDDDKNVYLEIRAGTGGDEAALFAGNLWRLYQMYASKRGWRVAIVNSAESDQGGYKELVVHVKGKRVFAELKYESGTHRVQRVPVTESQGRIHTSACTVAILPEVDELDAVELDNSEIRVDTFRSSGAGGQHVNTTDSAVRLTHIPTGIVVECQDERSQHKNKARAMSLLQAKILSVQKEAQAKERSEQRRLQVGSGDRSERIRTYNYPQGRVTDHRINLTLYKLEQLMEGALDLLVEPLAQEDQADKMSRLDHDVD